MSRIHLEPFDYYEPETLQEACAHLASLEGKAQVMAGGIDLIPRYRSGAADCSAIISIARLPELKYYRFDREKGMDFGAMMTLHEFELCGDAIEVYPELQRAVHQITSTQTRIMGTVVGNIAQATPATDVGPALMAYDAQLLICGPEGERRELVKDFYVDYRKSSLKKGEIVKGVHIPVPGPGTGCRFINRNRTHGDIAKISTTCLLQMEGKKCVKARIALGSVAAIAYRDLAAEAVLEGQEITEDLLIRASEVMQSSLHPITDIRSTADYRLEVTRVLVERALISAWEKAMGGEA